MDKCILNYHRNHSSIGRSSHGSLQKAISAKIDCSLLEDIEAERRTTGVPTNRLINMAVRWYLQELDEARREAAHGTKEKNLPTVTEEAAVKYILSRLTAIDRMRFLNYCKVRKVSPLRIIGEAINRLLDDYDKRPFSHL